MQSLIEIDPKLRP